MEIRSKTKEMCEPESVDLVRAISDRGKVRGAIFRRHGRSLFGSSGRGLAGGDAYLFKGMA